MVATLSEVSGIVRNLRNVAKKSGNCQENCWVFSDIRKMSGIFYDISSRDIPCFKVFCSLQKKVLNVTMNLKHLIYFNQTYNQCQMGVGY